MATKKNLVKSMLMSVATAGIFSFSFVFTSCNDDDILESGVTPPDMEQEYNGPLQEPYGLSFYDFVTSNDVTILNADTTQISISKALSRSRLWRSVNSTRPMHANCSPTTARLAQLRCSHGGRNWAST